MNDQWHAVCVYNPQTMSNDIYASRPVSAGMVRWAVGVGEHGHVEFSDRDAAVAGDPLMSIGLLDVEAGFLTALASALVEHAPAQSETEGRLEEVREALRLERERIDGILGGLA